MTQMLFNKIKGLDSIQDEYYATPPEATQLFLDNFKEISEITNFWEPACGGGAISKVLTDNLFNVKSTDLINRNFGEIANFLDCTEKFNGSIITNPPFTLSKEFVIKALDLIPKDEYAIFLVRIQFAESKMRRELFYKNIHSIYLHSTRIGCAENGDFSVPTKKGMTFAWFVFKKDFIGTTSFYWL